MPAVYPIEWLSPEVRHRWPHMAKRDSIAWAKFLDAHASEYGAFAYDVAMGGHRLDAPGLDEADRRGWQYNTAVKIDAVGLQPDRVVLFEVRPEAQTSSVGAVLCYTLIARRDQVFELPIEPAIVCEYVQPDVAWVAGELGITLYRVEP